MQKYRAARGQPPIERKGISISEQQRTLEKSTSIPPRPRASRRDARLLGRVSHRARTTQTWAFDRPAQRDPSQFITRTIRTLKMKVGLQVFERCGCAATVQLVSRLHPMKSGASCRGRVMRRHYIDLRTRLFV